ncbi:MAG: N-acetylmuramoyl-L-alanine amidase [Bacteroidales bacterium]|nr:N-acetylmuramoyl-L-alanine amidase [Bacteroidales bacterium]
MRRLLFIIISALLPLMAFAQNENVGADCQLNESAFEAAYKAFPQIPKGLLEAVSFTNTHCHHLTDADYTFDDSTAMPRAYGLMGLVKNGKNYFRENLFTVSQLSGIEVGEMLESPSANVMAYASAFAKIYDGKGMKSCLLAVSELSELPMGEEKDVFPMNVMLYSVCSFLNDEVMAERFDFQKYDIDLKSVFGDDLPFLSAKGLRVSGESDYPNAIWNPAPECNFGERTNPVSGVVIHYTEGSYAGCISWFKNCDAQVSAHYVIRSSDGQVTQMVREADKAWHARSANAYTIGIEHEAYGDIVSYFTDAMYKSSADLVRDICSRYETIDGHRTFYRDTLDSGIRLNEGLHSLGGESACTKIRGHQHYPDQSHTDPGPYWDWNYYYKLINQGSAATVLEGEQGELNHKNYGDDERKLWVIRGPEGSRIQIDFKSFRLETDYDFLWIYDGEDEYAPKIGRWNTKSPGSVAASGNVMCIEFRSDCATNAAGWEAKWEAKFPEPPEPEPAVGVYPNPANDFIRIHVDGQGFYDASLYDVCGREVVPNVRFVKETAIDLSSLRQGVYFLYYGKAFENKQVVKIVKVK